MYDVLSNKMSINKEIVPGFWFPVYGIFVGQSCCRKASERLFCTYSLLKEVYKYQHTWIGLAWIFIIVWSLLLVQTLCWSMTAVNWPLNNNKRFIGHFFHLLALLKEISFRCRSLVATRGLRLHGSINIFKTCYLYQLKFWQSSNDVTTKTFSNTYAIYCYFNYFSNFFYMNHDFVIIL